jgi:hypothetical protein
LENGPTQAYNQRYRIVGGKLLDTCNDHLRNDPATHGTSLDFSLSDLAIDNLFLAKYSALRVNKVR